MSELFALAIARAGHIIVADYPASQPQGPGVARVGRTPDLASERHQHPNHLVRCRTAAETWAKAYHEQSGRESPQVT